MSANPGSSPRRVVTNLSMNGLDVKIEDVSVDRHGVFYAHDELDIRRAHKRLAICHRLGLKEVAQVKGFDLRLDAVGAHFLRQPFDQ